MSELGEDFRAFREDKQRRHALNYENNLEALLVEFGPHNFVVKGEVCLFRQKGKPRVDFYPSTGRWKVKDRVFHGHANSFIKWYEKQNQ